MTEIGFYHLTRFGLEKALPQLLQKTVDAGKRGLVVLGSDDRVAAMDNYLWSFDNASWLPHASRTSGAPEEQPVWIDTDDRNPNGATFLFLADGGVSDNVADFERCFEIFDGNDDTAVAAARQRWTTYKDAGHDLTYWQQGESGWEKKA